MKKYFALVTVCLFAACLHSGPRRISVGDVEKLVVSGYRGPVVVTGYFHFDPEFDSLSEGPRGKLGKDVYLSLAPIVKREKITDWMARQRFTEPYDNRFVVIEGTLCREPIHLGGPIAGPPNEETFIRVEQIKPPNKALEPTAMTLPPATTSLAPLAHL